MVKPDFKSKKNLHLVFSSNQRAQVFQVASFREDGAELKCGRSTSCMFVATLLENYFEIFLGTAGKRDNSFKNFTKSLKFR